MQMFAKKNLQKLMNNGHSRQQPNKGSCLTLLESHSWNRPGGRVGGESFGRRGHAASGKVEYINCDSPACVLSYVLTLNFAVIINYDFDRNCPNTLLLK